MAAGKYNFVIEQGTTVDFDIAYKDFNNEAINLTDYSGRMQIKDKVGGNITHITLASYSQTVPDDKTGLDFTQAASGIIKIFISAHSSSLLDFNKASYDLEIASGSEFPIVTRLLQGSVTLDKEVTTFEPDLTA